MIIETTKFILYKGLEREMTNNSNNMNANNKNMIYNTG